MTKEELRELAVWGVRKKLQDIEAQLASYQQEFPELFISDTKPLLLKAEPRPDGTSAWGAHTPTGAPRGTMMDSILAYLGEGPQRNAAIQKALGLKPGSVSGALHKLRLQRKVTRNDEDGTWALREQLRQKYLALPPSPSAPVAAAGNGLLRPRKKVPGSLASRIVQWLQQQTPGYLFTPDQILAALHLKKEQRSAVSSALRLGLKRGDVENPTFGQWRATTGAGKATAAPPALPLDGGAARPTGQKDGRKHNKGTRSKFWKERWYARLQEVGGQETIGESAKALGTVSACITTSARTWLKAGIIERAGASGEGLYRIGKKKPDSGVVAAAAAAYASQNGASA